MPKYLYLYNTNTNTNTMAILTVVAPLTTIGCGKLELGEHDLLTLTIGNVKSFIYKETRGEIPVSM